MPARPPTADPAYKSYFFGKGFDDLVATIKGAFEENKRASSELWGKGQTALAKSGALGVGLAAGWFGAAISVLIFGSPLVALLAVIHVAILAFFLILIFVSFTVVAIFEWLVRLVRRLVSVCPHCHRPVPLPIYQCDRCKARHPRLMPSSFGILFHRCRCDVRLPCTLFTNRGRLVARCPHCDGLLKRGHTETQKQFLAIVGGPKVGKSAYLFALARYLREKTAPVLGMTATFLSEDQERTYAANAASTDRGRPPEATDKGVRKAFDLLFQGLGRPDVTLYLYDHAGETFFDSQELVQHRFLDFLSGILLLIDPFSFPEVRERYAGNLTRDPGVRPSDGAPDEILARLFSVMEETFGFSPQEKIRTPLAVVINKVDAFDLETRIGESALDKIAASAGGRERERQRNRMITGCLQEWGQSHFVQQIEMRFSTVNFYTASALGRSPDSARLDPFRPQGVVEPALWLLRRSHRMWPQPDRPGEAPGRFREWVCSPTVLIPGGALGAAAAVLVAIYLILPSSPPLVAEPVERPLASSQPIPEMPKIDPLADATNAGPLTGGGIIAQVPSAGALDTKPAWPPDRPVLSGPAPHTSDKGHTGNGSDVPSREGLAATKQGGPPKPLYEPLDGPADRATEDALHLDRAKKKEVQQRLVALGYNIGNPDGSFGRKTRGAIASFQRSKGANETGYLNESVYGELMREASLPARAVSESSDVAPLGSRSLVRQPELTRTRRMQAQERLKVLGYDPGPIDGQPGRRTRQAIAEYQRSLGLSPTGELNWDLYERLVPPELLLR